MSENIETLADVSPPTPGEEAPTWPRSTVPTGHSSNVDGTAIYPPMAALFVASAMGNPLGLGKQISPLMFIIIASKGAAGVTGVGLATLAGGLSPTAPTWSTVAGSSWASTGSCPRYAP